MPQKPGANGFRVYSWCKGGLVIPVLRDFYLINPTKLLMVIMGYGKNIEQASKVTIVQIVI